MATYEDSIKTKRAETISALVKSGMRYREAARIVDRTHWEVIKGPARRTSHNGRWEYRCCSCQRWLPPKRFHKHGKGYRTYLNKMCLSCMEWQSRCFQRVQARARSMQAYRRTTQARTSGEAVLRFYGRAAQLTEESGEPHHVDHIVPLVHPLVCGLHVAANLQVLKGRDNCSKGNKFVPYYEDRDGHVRPVIEDAPLSIKGQVKQDKPPRPIKIIKSGSPL